MIHIIRIGSKNDSFYREENSSNANLATCVQFMSDLGQNLFEPPTVKGWEGGRLWINSATMLQRANFAAEFSGGKRFGKMANPPRDLGSPNETVEHYLALLIGAEVSKQTRGDLETYLRKSGGSSGDRIRGLVQLVMTLPEYQLI